MVDELVLPDGLNVAYNRGGIAIIHGDCREVLPRLEAGSVDLIFTDPPYGHNNNNNGDLIARREAALDRGDYVPEANDRPIANDGAEEASELVRFLFAQSKRLLRSGACCCCCCCCGGGGPDPQFARWSLWMDEVLSFKQMVVWDKGPMGMGWHYRRSYETVLVAQRDDGKCNWYDDSDRIENIIRPGDYGIKKIIPSAHQHPTEKPYQLPMHFIKLHSKPGDLVLDPFMGAGSTLFAARMLGRKIIGIEIEKSWCDYTIERLRQEVLPL